MRIFSKLFILLITIQKCLSLDTIEGFDEMFEWRHFPLREVSHVCDTTGYGINGFTGFKITHQVGLEYPFQHHTRITYCYGSNVEGWDAYFPMNRTTEIKWGKRFCTSDHSGTSNCFIMARRRAATFRSVAFQVPHDWIGGLFRCPGYIDDDHVPCNNLNAFPILPLIVEPSVTNTWHEMPDLRHFIRRIPLVGTFGVLGDSKIDVVRYIPYNWWRFIDVHENYDYEDGKNERKLARSVLDFFGGWFSWLANFYVGKIIIPLTEEYYTDKGDGVPRRPTYRSFQRIPFDPVKWNLYPPFAPTRDFENEEPIKGIYDDDENVSEINRRFEKVVNNSTNQVCWTNDQQVQPLDPYSLDKIPIDKLITIISKIPEPVLNDFRKKFTEAMDKALPDKAIYDHPQSPLHPIEFLKQPHPYNV